MREAIRLDCLILSGDGKPVRPWLVVEVDDASRMITGLQVKYEDEKQMDQKPSGVMSSR